MGTKWIINIKHIVLSEDLFSISKAQEVEPSADEINRMWDSVSRKIAVTARVTGAGTLSG